jgi:phage-related minor tail protein
MADEQWIDVLPAMGNFNQRLVREATRSATQAGRRAGVGYSDAFEDAADGASDSAVSELEASEKRAAGLVSRLSGEVSKARQGMQRSAATQLTAEQRLADAVEKHGRESRQARAAELNLQAARGRAADATQRFENAEDGLREAQRSHTSITEDLAQAQQRAAESTDSASRSTGRMTGGLKGLIGRAKAATGGVGGLVTKMAAAAGGAKLLKDAFSQAMDKQNLTSNLEAQLGSTPKQAKRYGAAAASLYAKGYGENLDEVGTAVDGVVSSFKGLRNSSKKDIAAMTGYAMDLSKTFDVDLSESTTAASVMIKNGLAKNGTQAFDMMAGAMQKIPKGVRDEVLPTLTEYSKHYAQLGIDGNQAMMMIAAGAENGVIGVDKVGDAIKEFTIRGTDMSKSTTATYKALGLNTKQITNDLLAGGDKAKGAMGQVVTALQGVKDPGNKANMAISLFGTQLEDLGTENVPEFLKMINPATQETGKFAGTAKKMGDTLHSGAANGLETAKRSFQNMLSKGVAPLLGPVEKFTTWATKTPGVLQGLTIGLGAVAAAWLGVTLAASPWLAIAAGVGLAIAGIIVVIKNWGKIWNWLKNNVIGPFFNWLKPGFKAIGDWLKSVYESIIKPVFHAFAAIGKWLWLNILKPTFLAMRTGFKIIATVFLAQWVIIKALFKAFAAVGRWLWKNALKPAFGWIKAGFKALGTAIGIVYRAVIKPIFQAYAAIGRWLWTHALKPAFGWIKTGFRALGAGIGIVYRTLIKPIFKAAGVVGKWLWTNALKPAFNGIKAGWKGMTNGMKWVWDHVLHPVFKAVKKVIGSVADSFKIAKKAIKTAWDGLKKIAAAPVNFVIKWVYNKGIKPLWNGVTKVFGGKTLKKIDPIKYRTGGVTPGYTPGRDVHHYYSPTGGALDLSGGEAVMRPEFTRAVGSGWVNGINAAARTGGVAGVKSALGQGQAFKDGGLVKPLHGWQTDFHNFGESRAGGKHQGDDLAVGTGTPVYAVMDGKVA